MPGMQNRPQLWDVSDVQPRMHLVRGPADTEPGEAANCSVAMLRSQNESTARLANLRPRREGDSSFGRWATRDWAGKKIGVRAPDDDETPLSQEEVRFAMTHCILRSFL